MSCDVSEDNPFIDMIRDTVRTIRDETERKTRQIKFRDKQSPEEQRRTEERLMRFIDACNWVLGEEEE